MQTIYLDISNKGVIPCVVAKQSEVGRKFLAVITDNGVPYNIPDNSLLSVWYEGDTDAGNYSSIEENSAFSIDGNKVIVELVAQMLLKPGKGDLCLSVTHCDGGETNTWNIPYEVEYKPGAGSAVPTEYYTALTDAAARAAEQVALATEQAEIATEKAEDASDLVETLGTALTDYIVEQGIIDNWQYRKWKSGIVECWKDAIVVIPEDMTQGIGVFYTTTIMMNYPFTIYGALQQITSRTGGVISAQITTSSNNAFNFRFYCTNNTISGNNANVSLHILGTWK